MKHQNKLAFYALSLLFFFNACKSPEKANSLENVKTKPIYMWFDSEANYERLSYPDSIQYYLEKVKAIGVTDVVVDIKNIMGETLYESNIAPYMGEYEGATRPLDYDMLGIFIAKGKELNIGVHASLNVFVGGHNFIDRGIIYDQHPEWQSQNYWIDEIRPISTMKWNYDGMLNPALPEVQDYEISILKEVAEKFPDLDGVVLDRVRYDGITADFSEFSKTEFEKYAGFELENFPEDIITWHTNEAGNPDWAPSTHFNKWIEWRTKIIYDFFVKARREVKSVNADLSFGTYTGAWYPVYYELGVNWASKDYDPAADYDWATDLSKNFGYAEQLDLYMTGLYFSEVTIDEVRKLNEENNKNKSVATMGKPKEDWSSVEGGSILAKKLVKGAAPVIGSILVDQYVQDAEQFRKATTMALESTDGLMIFDLVYIIKNDWWSVLEQGISEAKQDK